jgi:hypothetical protein
MCVCVQRAQDLVKASFQGISKDFTTPLQDCFKAAQQAPPAAPGGYYAPQWPEHTELGMLANQLGAVSRTAGANSRSYRLRKRPRHGRVSAGLNTHLWIPPHFSFSESHYITPIFVEKASVPTYSPAHESAWQISLSDT